MHICCKLQKISSKTDFKHIFNDFIQYIALGQGQKTPWGQTFDVNRKPLSLRPFVAIFKQISLNSDLYTFFNVFLIYTHFLMFEIDEMQCGFMSGRGTADAIFIVRQLQEKHLAANRPLYMAFVDLEKAFNRVPQDVIWWAMRRLGTDEWLVRLVQSMYKDVRSRVRVGDGYSEEFGVGVGVHHGSVLSRLLFIIIHVIRPDSVGTYRYWVPKYESRPTDRNS